MVAESDARTSLLGRRRLMELGTAVAGGGTIAAMNVATAAMAADELPISPPEDLMREHGVLKRALLVYREVIARIERGDDVPRHELGGAASVIRSLIHDHHEHVEERYLFSVLLRANRMTSTVEVLRSQHEAGRMLTSVLLTVDNTRGAFDRRARQELVETMAAFIRMYEPHEAREDTEVFPAFRAIMPPQTFADLSERLREEEYRRFGPMGFSRYVRRIADIEKSLGINELAQFTPTVPVARQAAGGPA
ncbi:hemerythrin domain-containing protein [Thermopolyspora sp. NPDC052614]|uniref:hemerythrin domain-containing protein n=1 Tax=Thermopolyspora sp. NPDC052614 TaxID=3155682 RepID=UPI00341B4B4A